MTIADRMAEVVGAANVVTDPAELLVYEADGLTHGRTRPDLVVLPGSTAEVVEVVGIARDAGTPIVPRGAGTGLSGGARPSPGSRRNQVNCRLANRLVSRFNRLMASSRVVLPRK